MAWPVISQRKKSAKKHWWQQTSSTTWALPGSRFEIKMISTSEAQTFQTGRELAESMPLPAHILLYGDLGAGKTSFTRGLAAGFGLQEIEEVASPTFTLINEYYGT